MHRNWYQIWYPIWRKSQNVVNFKIVLKKSESSLVDFGYRCQILQRTPDLFKYLVSGTFFEKHFQSPVCTFFESILNKSEGLYLHSKEILSTLEFACHQRLLFCSIFFLRLWDGCIDSISDHIGISTIPKESRNRKGPINSSGIRIHKESSQN